MATFGFICPALPGHINPMAVLARELMRRGHAVTFVGFPDMAAAMPSDLAFASFGADEPPLGSLQAYLRRLSRLGRVTGVRRLIRDLAGFAETTCRDLPSCLESLQVDCLVIDQTDAAASLVARALGVPFVSMANALPLNPEPGVPPPVLPWPYDASPKGMKRNLGGYQVARIIERPITHVIRRYAKRFGLAGIRYSHETWSDRCQLTQCIKSLDFPRRELPTCFHYVGPFREPENPPGVPISRSGRPLVFCSLGSLQGSRIQMFRRIAAAADDLGVDLLIAHGGLLPDSAFEGLIGHPRIHAFVPQRTVLAQSALAITHGGFNTVLDSLNCGTPMVVLPIAFEQPGTGARITRAGVGEALNRNRSRARIRRMMVQVLSDSSYRANAAQMSKEIAAAGGVTLAADLIEQSCGLSGHQAAPTTVRRASGDARDDSQSENM